MTKDLDQKCQDDIEHRSNYRELLRRVAKNRLDELERARTCVASAE